MIYRLYRQTGHIFSTEIQLKSWLWMWYFVFARTMAIHFHLNANNNFQTIFIFIVSLWWRINSRKTKSHSNVSNCFHLYGIFTARNGKLTWVDLIKKDPIILLHLLFDAAFVRVAVCVCVCVLWNLDRFLIDKFYSLDSQTIKCKKMSYTMVETFSRTSSRASFRMNLRRNTNPFYIRSFHQTD